MFDTMFHCEKCGMPVGFGCYCTAGPSVKASEAKEWHAELTSVISKLQTEVARLKFSDDAAVDSFKRLAQEFKDLSGEIDAIRALDLDVGS